MAWLTAGTGLESVCSLISFPDPKGFPGSSDGKAFACNVGDPVSIPGGKIPWRRRWQPTPVLLPGKSHGWRSLSDFTVFFHSWISSCLECFLLMMGQRSGRGQTTSAHPSTSISAQTPPADIPLAKPSHMAKPKVRNGAVPSACRKATQA